MTEDERDDIMAELAARYIAAVHEGDDAEILEIVGGPWDGKTSPPALWAVSILMLLEQVAHMIPAAQIDWAAIEDAMTGKFPLDALTPIGKHEVISRLARGGLTDQEIADRIGMNKNAVCRYRNRNRIPAGVPLCNRVSA